MSSSLPCLMTRKKKVPGTREFNASKVLADFCAENNTLSSYYNDAFQRKVATKKHAAGINNRANPNKVCFLYENPRFVNEPICYANTRDTSSQQSQWWPQRTPNDTKPKPSYKSDTVSRQDYKNIKERPKMNTRYGSNEQKYKIAQGMVPDLTDKEFIALEKISYEHQFDCRKGRKDRGTLHGSFVWEPIVNNDIKERIKNRLTQNQSHIFT